MNLRVYYQKIRTIEAEIAEPFAVIISRETADGGKAGVKSDVPRYLAAKLITEEKADLASPEEAAKFRAESSGKPQADAGEPGAAGAEAGDRSTRNALRPTKKN
jgi:hypothetical protein